MSRVRLLDDALIDQIAAGEVVERPASVVKELIDNAIDAGAKQIRVELREGGRERILVQDDGEGMNRDDATMAVRRHATSKLSSVEDLAAIRTLGFRGEALASIASVSRFRLLTRTRDTIEGSEVRIAGGGKPEIRAAGCAPGTTIDVQELFYNVPARRKFLRARQTEVHHVQRACLHAALANPLLHLSLHHNGRLLREFLPARTRTERARRVFGDLPLFEVRGEGHGIRVEAVLSLPSDARRGPRHLRIFVNGRPVVDRQLAFAVAFAMEGALRPGQYPVGTLFVELDAKDVDVNAHPQKTEVRFHSPRTVADVVSRVVRQSFHRASKGDSEVEALTSAEPTPANMGSLPPRPGFWKSRLPSGPSQNTKANPPAAHAAGAESKYAQRPASQREGSQDAAALELARALRGDTAVATSAPTSPTSTIPTKTPESDTASVAAQTAIEARATSDEPQKHTPHSRPAKAPPRSDEDFSAATLGVHRVGVLRDGQWVIEADDALLVVDPKRIDAELTRRDFDPLVTTELVFPARVDVEQRGVELEHDLKALGLDLSHLGGRTFAVHALPSALAAAAPEVLVMAALRGGIEAMLAQAPPRPDAERQAALAEPVLRRKCTLRAIDLTDLPKGTTR